MGTLLFNSVQKFGEMKGANFEIIFDGLCFCVHRLIAVICLLTQLVGLIMVWLVRASPFNRVCLKIASGRSITSFSSELMLADVDVC